MGHNFDDIRPYYDSEVKQALTEIIAEPEFGTFLKYIFPDSDPAKLSQQLVLYNTIYDFQANFTSQVVRTIIQRSITELTSNGLQKLDKKGVYLFMSNHRDIVLDPALMDLVLFENGFGIPQLAIGNNLLISPLVTKIFRINKSFIVQRNESPRQMYAAWKKLSAYISHVITERKENLWIAQREGRAKDGDDRTMTGILKMFLMNFGDDYVEEIYRLNIIPVSISYEYDPCDLLKAVELYHRSKELPFSKDSTFNMQSMVTGIQGRKGRVHVAFGKPISDMLHENLEKEHPNDIVKWLAIQIDREIHLNYKLWPSNYLAHDLLFNTNAYADKYTSVEKTDFINRLDTRLKDAGEPRDEIRTLILKSYTNSLINQIEAREGNI